MSIPILAKEHHGITEKEFATKIAVLTAKQAHPLF